MWRSALRFILGIYTQAGMVATLSGASIFVVLAGVSAYLAKQTAWIASYGPIGWWTASLIGVLLGALILVAFAHFRLALAKGAAIKKWQQDVRGVNPLDQEFTRFRIRILDIVSPITNRVDRKRFVDCELMGPATIVFEKNINLSGTAFYDCDVVVMRPDIQIFNVAPFSDVQLIGGAICKCTIYIPFTMINTFRGMGANFVSLTGRPDIDNAGLHPGRATGPSFGSHPSPKPPKSPTGTSPQSSPG